VATPSGSARTSSSTEEQKEDLLHVLDQADLDQLDHELRDLQTMLRGERWTGEPQPPATPDA
jgi:hypothetical protein